jgi:hypothetical protein
MKRTILLAIALLVAANYDPKPAPKVVKKPQLKQVNGVWKPM